MMREEVLSLVASKRRTLTLFAALLVAMGALFGLDNIRTAETQTPPPPPPTTYEVQDLGTLGGAPLGGIHSVARGINDSGTVVGYSYTSDGSAHAFLKESGQPMQDLGTLGGTNSVANGINDSGTVVGQSSTSDGFQHAFLKESGQPMQDLGTLGGAHSIAHSINDSGTVVGRSNTSGGIEHAFLKESGQPMEDLGTLDGEGRTMAFDINNSGTVVGSSDVSDAPDHAFLKESGQPMEDLGTLEGGSRSFARGINDSDTVVGEADVPIFSSRPLHAFLKESGQPMEDLGALEGDFWSVGVGINDSGTVVGQSLSSGTSGAYRAYLKESGQPMSALNDLIPADSGWNIDEAQAINSDGKIAASGYKDGGAKHALLLTPEGSSEDPPPDTTNPTITLTTPASNATYKRKAVVNAEYSCADEEGGSELKSCDGTLPNGSPIDTSTTGTKTFTVVAEDNAGNTETVTHTYAVTNSGKPAKGRGPQSK